jgi:hypothetical protein
MGLIDMKNMTKIKKRNLKKNCLFDSIHAEEDFLSMLKHERLRTLRNGVPFSLLVFKTTENSEVIPELFLSAKFFENQGWTNCHSL